MLNGLAELCWYTPNRTDTCCAKELDFLYLHFCVQDTLNDRSTAAVEALLDGGWEGSRQGRDAKHVVMLTGDNPASANRIARLVGISDVRAVRQ